MAGAYGYAFTPDIWPPLAAVVILAALGLYAWRRRDVPAARVLAAWALCCATSMLAATFEAAAVAPAATLAWYRIRDVCVLVAITAGTCFVVEYVQPGRWLTRRNLALLALPVLLLAFLVTADGGRLLWGRLEVGADGSVLTSPTMANVIVMAYGMGLVLINAAALLWLFIRSSAHRWPATFLLSGQFANRVVFMVAFSRLSSLTATDATVIGALVTAIMYVAAVFGFRMLDPQPAARRAALEQMRDGMVVFDAGWRVASINRAAAAMLGVDTDRVSGRTLEQLLPTLPDLCARLADADHPFDTTEISLRTGAGACYCTVYLSPLRDFRGLVIGRLLMLHNLTEQRRAEARLVEQQRTLAVLQERERLARELHDSLGQVLAAAHLQANTARLLLDQGRAAQAGECLGLLADATLEAEGDVRDYLLGVKTVTSGEGRFFATLHEYLQRFTRQSGLPVQLAVPPEMEEQGLSEAVEVQLFRIIQEALANVRKHARARCAQVTFSRDGSRAKVAIVDDGQGFDPAAIAAQGERYGLQAMAERAEATGGSLKVISSPGQGTRVEVEVPVGGEGERGRE